jgi:hypothetical protein
MDIMKAYTYFRGWGVGVSIGEIDVRFDCSVEHAYVKLYAINNYLASTNGNASGSTMV